MGATLGSDIQASYITWFDAMGTFSNACDEFLKVHNDQNAEDLGDWVESIRTLISFSPHPKAMWKEIS